ncbi:MAG: cofactor-independent phosphoglycerate mutase [Ruminococcus sp.]|jgi:2,3-bisphosphoglycerate-independent phosphoglycerate mutase|nr:cofactor-independent phosphoglycerate mutase [Ruminococcus sp.]
MKYIVLLCDGMADEPIPELGGKTPMECASKPNMDRLAAVSEVGLAKTVEDGMKPGSDVANLAVLGYNAKECYTGRSPLEAGSIGIDMTETDVSFRCNLVTLSDEPRYEDKTMVDYCAGDISTEEAAQIIKTIGEHFDNDEFKFYSGVAYRHCLIWYDGTTDVGTLTPPHDISGQKVKLSDSPNAIKLIDMMKKSVDILASHPVNIERQKRGERPANSIWLWGEGTRANLEPFITKYGKKAAMISAVDLLKGIGKFAGMEVIDVPGATGYIDTNFDGKAEAAIDTLKRGNDLVYIHVEAPDECGHRGEVDNKVRAIELIDEKILAKLLASDLGDFKILICPDHPTPLGTKTHTRNPVPYMIYDSREAKSGVDTLTEKTAASTGIYFEHGYEIMGHFLEKQV